jgi:hypothetical protein
MVQVQDPQNGFAQVDFGVHYEGWGWIKRSVRVR